MVPDNPVIGSPEDVNRLWDLISRRGTPPSKSHRLQFSIACPTRAAGEFLVQYLTHSNGFVGAALKPAVSEDGQEYWDLQIDSYEGSLALGFLQRACSIVRLATTRFACRLYAWGKAHEADHQAGGLTSA